jgi:hypothetical protein
MQVVVQASLNQTTTSNQTVSASGSAWKQFWKGNKNVLKFLVDFLSSFVSVM